MRHGPAQEIIASAPIAVKTALKTIRSIPDLSEEDALNADTEAGVIALTSGEPAVGIQAFLAKKDPDWSLVPQ
jgi:1,4-dihydroxy-2-naphthoyl-CoA synthase